MNRLGIILTIATISALTHFGYGQTPIGHIPKQHNPGLIWMTCDICGKAIHGDKEKIDRGSKFEKSVDPTDLHDDIIHTRTATSGNLIYDGSDVQTDVLTLETKAVNVGPTLVASDENSAVIAGHENHTKHICKACYDEYTPKIFQKVDEEWGKYWYGIRDKMKSTRERNRFGLDLLSLEKQIDSLRGILRKYR